MNIFFQKIRLIFADKLLRKRILFTLAALILFRLFANIPIPGVQIGELQTLFANNQFLGLLNMFSGGGLSNLSIVMLGVGPFITASIIMQLMTMVSTKLKALYQEEGESGRLKFAQYSRLLTIPIALIQAVGFVVLLQRQGVLANLSLFELVVNIVVIAVGSILLMWIGELITEFGVGNGVSLLIFAGIVARLPQVLGQFYFSFTQNDIPLALAFLVIAVVVTIGVVIITEAERPIPITYAKQVRGKASQGSIATYLPLRLNQAGVIPIIFALSVLLFPQMIFNFLSTVSNTMVASASQVVLNFLSNGWVYAALYFIFVFLFTYFYTAVTFDPEAISENLQKSGAFIPGIRPGHATEHYIATIITRLTLFGAAFLGLIAVLPLAMRAVTNQPELAIGGTALLIVVSVVIDLVKKIDAQVSVQEY